jgi:hypothetical protein
VESLFFLKALSGDSLLLVRNTKPSEGTHFRVDLNFFTLFQTSIPQQTQVCSGRTSRSCVRQPHVHQLQGTLLRAAVPLVLHIFYRSLTSRTFTLLWGMRSSFFRITSSTYNLPGLRSDRCSLLTFTLVESSESLLYTNYLFWASLGLTRTYCMHFPTVPLLKKSRSFFFGKPLFKLFSNAGLKTS